MRPARLGLIGAVLLVALHAFLFASGEGHHSDPVPASSIAELLLLLAGVRGRVRPAPRQLHHDRSTVRPRLLIGMVTGNNDRREPVDGRLVRELDAVAWPFVSQTSVRTPR